MKLCVMIVGLMLVCFISQAQVNEPLPEELFRSEWRQGETRLQFLKSGEIIDSGANRIYKIVSVTKPDGNYIVVASFNTYYIHMVLGTDKIERSNALMISYDPNNLYTNLDAAGQGSNGRMGWLYREKP